MSGEITPIPPRPGIAAAGAEVSIAVAASTHEGSLDPAQALREALEREFESLQEGAHVLTRRMYAQWGRRDSPEAVAARAEEVLQEAVARVWQQAASYDQSRRVRPWVMRFATFVLLEQERGEWPHQQGRVELEGERQTEDASAATAVLDRLHDLRQTAEQEARALLELVSAEDAALLREAYLDGATRNEMAAARGIPPGTLRVRLLRAAQHFRHAYQRATEFGS